MRGRSEEFEEWVRHALTVVAFVENKSERDKLELEATNDLARFLLETDRYEEAGPLIERWRELATTDSDNMIRALASAVYFQARRGDVEQAKKEMKVVPSYPPLLESRNSDPSASPPPQAPGRSAG